jgi:hypothetical protein
MDGGVFEKSVTTNQSTRRNIPEASNTQQHRTSNPKPGKLNVGRQAHGQNW